MILPMFRIKIMLTVVVPKIVVVVIVLFKNGILT